MRAVGDNIDFLLVHKDTVRRDDISEEFHSVGVEIAFLGFAEEVVRAKSFEHFADMLNMLVRIVGIDEDIVEVNHDVDVKEVGENVVHEGLKSGRSIGETERHNEIFICTIASAECGFPLVASSNSDIAISDAEIELGVDLRRSETFEGARN